MTAEVGAQTPVLTSFGEIASRRTLELRAADTGRVIALAEGFEDGGAVTVGDVLVRIDPADAQSAVLRAQSDLADAEAEERDAARGLVLAQDELVGSTRAGRVAGACSRAASRFGHARGWHYGRIRNSRIGCIRGASGGAFAAPGIGAG